MPSWTEGLLWREGQSLRAVKYLLTFKPFTGLPKAVCRAYLKGGLHLLPFPGSLLFWGAAFYLALEQQLPLAIQIPLLHSLERHEAPLGIRIPQSGALHEPRPDKPLEPGHQGPLRSTFKRTHRWARVHRYEDELACTTNEDRVAHVLFSEAADDLGLYGKPMARNAQIWTHDFRLLLNGPRATRDQLRKAAREMADGGLFGYRFFYPPMQVGRHAVYWQRPLVAFRAAGAEHPTVFLDGPAGYLTAYDAQKPRPDRPIELWPRQLAREPHVMAVRNFRFDHDVHYHQTSNNIRKLLDVADLSQGRHRLPGPRGRDAGGEPSSHRGQNHEPRAASPEPRAPSDERVRGIPQGRRWSAGTERLPEAGTEVPAGDGGCRQGRRGRRQ